MDYYTCEEAIARLNEFLDRELSPNEQEAVQRHLDLCEDCFRHFEFDACLMATIHAKCRQVRAPTLLQRRICRLLDQL